MNVLYRGAGLLSWFACRARLFSLFRVPGDVLLAALGLIGLIAAAQSLIGGLGVPTPWSIRLSLSVAMAGDLAIAIVLLLPRWRGYAVFRPCSRQETKGMEAEESVPRGTALTVHGRRDPWRLTLVLAPAVGHIDPHSHERDLREAHPATDFHLENMAPSWRITIHPLDTFGFTEGVLYWRHGPIPSLKVTQRSGPQCAQDFYLSFREAGMIDIARGFFNAPTLAGRGVR